MSFKRIYITLVILLLGCSYAFSQEKRAEVLVYFRANGMYIDEKYKDNIRITSELDLFLQQVRNDSTIRVKRVYFTGAASPEGSYEVNRMMADGRRNSLEQYVLGRIEIPDSVIIRDKGYIPWDDFASMVRESDIAQKDAVLDIIADDPLIVKYYNRTIDNRVKRLMALEGGRTWREMKRRFFMDLRYSGALFVIDMKYPLPVVASVSSGAVCVSPGIAGMDRRLTKPEPAIDSFSDTDLWTPGLTVKTNILGLGMAISNAAVEIDLCRHLSLNIPVYYSAWNYFDPAVKFRTLAFQPEIRWWFSGRRPINDGLFAGAHFGLAYYNVAAGTDYRLQDHDGRSPALGGGLSVGYRFPLGRNSRWKLEFSAGAGAYSLHYDRFHNYHNGLMVSTEKKTYVGLDQASMSLSYSFGLMRKGGGR